VTGRTRTRALGLVAVMAAAVLAIATAIAPAADSTRTKAFHSHNKAVTPQATGDPNDPTTYEDFPFTIKKGQRYGTINAHVEWTNPADDWDLYVYRKKGTKLQTIGSSAGAPPATEENAVADSQGIPWKAGKYVVRVVNYTAVLPSFKGTIRFGPFVPYSKNPIAKLNAPGHVAHGKRVTLDASKSHDPDGHIVDYAFDLDGNGFMETDNGKHAVLRRKLRSGTHYVGLRVIDDKGLRGYAKRKVVVAKKH
jgi:hypothetical protein